MHCMCKIKCHCKSHLKSFNSNSHRVFIDERYRITLRMEPGLARFVHFSPPTSTGSLSEAISLSLYFFQTHSCSVVTFERAPWPEVVSDVGSCICRDKRCEQYMDGRSATTCRTIQVAGCRHVHEYIGQKKKKSNSQICVCLHHILICPRVFIMQIRSSSRLYLYCTSYIKVLTWKDSACPYFALILGSRMVARLVPLTVNGVPPLQTQKVNGSQISVYSNTMAENITLQNYSLCYELIRRNKRYHVLFV